MLFFNNLIPHQSMENYSDIVRWSFDLRWQVLTYAKCILNLLQNPDLGSGFEGKPPIMMRDPEQPGMKPDWETWAALNPFALRGNNVDDLDDSSTVELDSVITGEH